VRDESLNMVHEDEEVRVWWIRKETAGTARNTQGLAA